MDLLILRPPVLVPERIRVPENALQVFHPVYQLFIQPGHVHVGNRMFLFCFNFIPEIQSVLYFFFVQQNHPRENLCRYRHVPVHFRILPGKDPIDHFKLIPAFTVHTHCSRKFMPLLHNIYQIKIRVCLIIKYYCSHSLPVSRTGKKEWTMGNGHANINAENQVENGQPAYH